MLWFVKSVIIFTLAIMSLIPDMARLLKSILKLFILLYIMHLVKTAVIIQTTHSFALV